MAVQTEQPGLWLQACCTYTCCLACRRPSRQLTCRWPFKLILQAIAMHVRTLQQLQALEGVFRPLKQFKTLNAACRTATLFFTTAWAQAPRTPSTARTRTLQAACSLAACLCQVPMAARSRCWTARTPCCSLGPFGEAAHKQRRVLACRPCARLTACSHILPPDAGRTNEAAGSVRS